jgi:hypothetical protein
MTYGGTREKHRASGPKPDRIANQGVEAIKNYAFHAAFGIQRREMIFHYTLSHSALHVSRAHLVRIYLRETA